MTDEQKVQFDEIEAEAMVEAFEDLCLKSRHRADGVSDDAGSSADQRTDEISSANAVIRS